MSTVTGLYDDLIGDVDAIFLFSPNESLLSQLADTTNLPIIVVAPDDSVGADVFVELPLQFGNVAERISYGIEGALDRGLVAEGDVVGCIASVFAGNADTAICVRVSEPMRSGVYELFVNSRADSGVIRDVFEVAVELGKKGQKDKRVGALFVIGDSDTVMNTSRPLSYNPFDKIRVIVGDPIVNVMVKEFSRLDGAFVISDSGTIVSAYRYLEASTEGVDIPKGLGARHMAAGAITSTTDATAVVLSESDGLVRAFRNAQLVTKIDPDEY
jgi:Uncharacterized conserved protein